MSEAVVSTERARAPHALVTGASGGLGRALVHELAAHGYSVTLVARRRGVLDEIARDLGERAQVAETDLTRIEAAEDGSLLRREGGAGCRLRKPSRRAEADRGQRRHGVSGPDAHGDARSCPRGLSPCAPSNAASGGEPDRARATRTPCGRAWVSTGRLPARLPAVSVLTVARPMGSGSADTSPIAARRETERPCMTVLMYW